MTYMINYYGPEDGPEDDDHDDNQTYGVEI